MQSKGFITDFPTHLYFYLSISLQHSLFLYKTIFQVYIDFKPALHTPRRKVYVLCPQKHVENDGLVEACPLCEWHPHVQTSMDLRHPIPSSSFISLTQE